MYYARFSLDNFLTLKRYMFSIYETSLSNSINKYRIVKIIREWLDFKINLNITFLHHLFYGIR